MRLYWNNVIITVGAFCLEKKKTTTTMNRFENERKLYIIRTT